MSQEKLEPRALAEAAFGALNARDLDGFMAVTAEDVVFTSMVAEVEGATFRGPDGNRQWWETVVEAFGDVRWDARGGPGQLDHVACRQGERRQGGLLVVASHRAGGH